MDRILLCSGVMMVSKNGIDPSGPVSFTVNLKRLSLCVAGSSPYVLYLYHEGVINIFFKSLDGFSVVHKVLISNTSIYRLDTIRLHGEPMAAHSLCSQNWSWNRNYVLRQKLSSSMISFTDMMVLFRNLCLVLVCS